MSDKSKYKRLSITLHEEVIDIIDKILEDDPHIYKSRSHLITMGIMGIKQQRES